MKYHQLIHLFLVLLCVFTMKRQNSTRNSERQIKRKAKALLQKKAIEAGIELKRLNKQREYMNQYRETRARNTIFKRLVSGKFTDNGNPPPILTSPSFFLL